MAFKPNYRADRLERDRAKQAKKDDKARRRQERKAEEDNPTPPETPDEAPAKS
jgi:hypothetical protein